MTGTVLGNRYELLEKVGVGGMAVVYKAMDRLLNRNVAVKLLRSEFQGNEEFIRRFNIESQAAASLSHPNIVSIYDVGQSEGRQYIVMEYIEGKTLKEYIAEKKGNIYWKEATDIAMQICSALEHAHSKHIIHRDIKPQNIMINTENVIKVTDFGIARAASGGTMTMEAMGSAHYLSPEQARGGYTDQRSDIYSFGVLLYELYTGKLPFDGETTVAVAMQHMQLEPVHPSILREDLPKSIECIILKAMSKEQRLRYESAGLMLNDIKRAYTDPDSLVEIEDEEDKFGTKKITPIVNITMPTDNSGKTVVRRNEEDRIKKKKSNKKDVVAVVAAVITCIVVAIIMGVIVANVLSSRGVVEPVTFHMPNVQGLSRNQMTESLKSLREEGFEIEEVYEYNSNVIKGQVIDQVPKMGDIEEGVKIVITISNGKAKINIDDYTGAEAEEAIDQLEKMDLIVKTSQEMSDEIEEGKVIRHLPSAGHVLETGDSIRLFVSSGPNMFQLDSYVGSEYSEAKIELEAQGIEVSRSDEYSSSVPAGVVIRQNPAPSAEMKKGDKVELIVSLGVEMVSVPNLMDYTLDAATDALKNNKLKIGSATEISSGKAKGLIVKQSIAPDTKVSVNTVVNVWVSKGNETTGAVDTGADVQNVQSDGITSDTGL
ncbi:MAG: Stk1 family PASTA domain-containing Ser/Thr kinase [Clostridia bacterium]|nr:Stk1 family PASTA domain-containing Ser/Thr kinase [Clostridia bacterium]